ncbi:FecR family protein [Pedobacter paludis]|uniref:Anti-sigma factor n=1 Tax=Pedobacter paludis TaxID=2203212 RepID=A0A317EWN6_9SPHI|nr:FecR family protein [Pedobacter paludis]PWS30373.1 hypothetical protein DF947_18280 [Pedobacter paludis]
MNEQQIAELIRKYNDGTLTQDEKTALDIWYLKFASDSKAQLSEEKEALLVNKLRSNLPLHYKKPTVKLWPRIAAVAALLAVVISATFWALKDNDSHLQYTNDVQPGKTGATLTLANGKKIYIENAVAGNIADESGVKIFKTKDGQIRYEISGVDNGTIGYNTLSTSRGEQTQVQLPDGTVVFLNAASSLKYPTSFARAQKRKVVLTGEGYFEVSKDKMHPFLVEANNQTVEVLGTIFNINSYADEPSVKTTLLEGSVLISNVSSKNKMLLVPGEQATIKDMNLDVKAVEVDDVVAWKNGSFMFNNETLESIMKKVSRWYDVEVRYEDPALKQKTFFGSISRFDKLSEMLKLLQKTEGATFDIQGKQITVSKKN